MSDISTAIDFAEIDAVITEMIAVATADEDFPDFDKGTVDVWQARLQVATGHHEGFPSRTTRVVPVRDWRCPECRCHTYADISGSPGMIRCVNCKYVFALTTRLAPDRTREAIVRLIMTHVCDGEPETPEDLADAILSLMGEG